VFKKSGEKVKVSPEDISRSLLYAISNNIGQIACVIFFTVRDVPLTYDKCSVT
jgi:pantothenate kinase